MRPPDIWTSLTSGASETTTRGGIADYRHYPHEPYPDQPMSIEYYRHYFGTRYQSRDIGPLHIVLPYCPDQWETHAVRPDQDL